MRRRISRYLPGVSLAATAVLYGFGVVATFAGRTPIPDPLSEVIWPVPFLAFGAVGALVASRRPGHPIGWMFIGTALLMVLNFFATAYATYALLRGGDLPGGGLASWLSLWSWIPATVLFALIFLLFPTGRPPSRAWRWLVYASIAQEAALLVVVAHVYPRRGVRFVEASGMIGDIAGSPALDLVGGYPPQLLILAAAVSLLVRFRRSRGEERQQLKWFAYAAIMMGALILSTVALPVWGEDPMGNDLYGLFLLPVVSLVPVAAGIAILRYRLYDIDRLVNRTLVYGALTAILAAAYLGIVVALQNIIPGADDSDLTIAGSTLAVAALFRPLRSRVQGFIDRRFYRGKYDTQRTLESFSSRLREDVDLDHLSADLLGVVRDTMQPAHASLWLRGTVS